MGATCDMSTSKGFVLTSKPASTHAPPDKQVKSYGKMKVFLVGDMYTGTIKIKDIINFTMVGRV